MADDSNKIAVPMAVAIKGPADYPPDALQKREEGFAIVEIEEGASGLNVQLIRSSGYDDLDRASLEIAKSGKPSTPIKPGSNIFVLGVQWSLNPQFPKDGPITVPLP